jgi:hypothetical protein
MPIGTSISPGLATLPPTAKGLGAFRAFRAHAGVPIRAVQNDLRNVGVRFHIVVVGWLAPHTLHRREGWTRTRLSALTHDRCHQGCFFAANERSRANADFKVKVEIGAEDVVSQKAELSRLRNGEVERLHRQRIFRAAVNVAVTCANRVRADDHAFDHRMRIAFKHAAVHERARVAFIGITDHIFGAVLYLTGETPFASRREARAAASAQT